MKALGIVQFHQKKFKLLDLSRSKFKGLLGKVPRHFICLVKGYSGNGKTEFCVQLAKELGGFGKVAWLSYEQRHGYDLQSATKRNKMEELSGNFIPIDPVANLGAGVTFLEDLDNYLNKRSSPEYIFIDSIDYTGFNKADYLFLKNKYEGKKTFVFIAHSEKSGKLRKTISDDIVFDGGMCIWVKDFIAQAEKNRFGGFDPYVIFEPMARERNPNFFAIRVKEQSKGKQPDLFTPDDKEGAGVNDTIPTPDTGGKLHLPPAETMGVDAEKPRILRVTKARKTPVEV
ncbi:hypothetical protein H7F33_05590 [Pedobacter sp. PAMC26386]|nr:hypothetical protein H7F33_05590 [Pedobacter sp. PAMC26386]